ncbi:M23 family metallopeptidase [Stakelama sp. CBK3Z-3]|uniref:M23 family metallopeptidase n=1 Tax=Stakelama flava TaxID=2860338 RepID=A0ABS6XHS2_9SPHN|nr:M23 family metallopeptidase [Stakelama flava]MBW4329691.1 M23 family metallopeptidase [Stakelama flava]
MEISYQNSNASFASRFQNFFTTRDIILHDGHDLRRFSVSGRAQALIAGVAAVALGFSAYGAANAAESLVSGDGANDAAAKLSRMQSRLTGMQADFAAVKEVAARRAAAVERRQKLIAAVLSGQGAPGDFDVAALTRGEGETNNAAAADATAPLRKVEARQVAFAVKARHTAEARYRTTAQHLRQLGISPDRFAPAVGGPFEPVDAAEMKASNAADKQFHSLFMAWKKLDSLEQAVISIPSIQPVAHVTFSSTFGVRGDPFNGRSAMHSGVDIPGPLGTPVYATADGIVDRAGRAGGYGNLIEINHGRGIETRYGHLSKIIVENHQRVHRGDLIGLMGSTGRSTGSHLHYEVRIDGHAVNPEPYLENANYLASVQDRAVKTADAGVGGPAED